MKNQELRKKNLISEKHSGVMEVVELCDSYIGLKKPKRNVIDIYGIGDINGIKITKGILLKCGFKKGKYGMLELRVNGFTIRFDIFNNMDCYIEFVGVDCKYLHKLQNIVFDLTDKELKTTGIC